MRPPAAMIHIKHLAPIAARNAAAYHRRMFTIEHDFDATVITLVDEGTVHLGEDVTIEAFEDCVVLQQVDRQTDTPVRITLSLRQMHDLAAALHLPEGVYRLK